MSFLTHGIVINLDRRPDRLKTFTTSYYASVLGHTVPLLRLAAVDSAAIDVNAYVTDTARSELADLQVTKRRKFHAQLSPGAVGCYLSHLQAWQAVADASGPVLVMEDDLILPSTLQLHTLQRLFDDATAYVTTSSAPDAPWFLHLSIICTRYCDRAKPGVIRPLQSFWSTACYILTPESARKLLSELVPLWLPADVQIDARMCELMEHSRVHLLGTELFGTSAHDSDIQWYVVPDAPVTRQELIQQNVQRSSKCCIM